MKHEQGNQRHEEQDTDTRAGWKRGAWCRDAGISIPMSYKLPPEQQPEMVHIGRGCIITESPRDWLARMRRQQQAVA